ncbi:YEATS-associated helix-containing protein [Chryseobacterium sp. SIMBA_038]|uniref:YEATS-associated helix-containing protein n=1 Tax=Chryseobacterium sp. SIMBA_038 TaxID=3085780 RepID=UPI0039782544
MFTTITFLNEPTNNLIIIMLICGIVGGVGNTLRGTTCNWVVLSKNICLGIIASIAVPLFLNLVSSDIVKSIYLDEKNHISNYLIFSGFCIIASFSSLTFLNTISGKVIQNLKEEIKQVKSENEQLSKTVETIAISTESTQVNANELEKFKTLPYTEIINSIKNKENKFRPLDLIKTEVNQDNTEIDKKIEILKNNNLVKEIELRKGEKAFALTEDAEKIME